MCRVVGLSSEKLTFTGMKLRVEQIFRSAADLAGFGLVEYPAENEEMYTAL